MGSNRLKFAFLTILLVVLCKFYPLHAQSLQEVIEVRLLADHQEIAAGTSGWLGIEVNLVPVGMFTGKNPVKADIPPL